MTIGSEALNRHKQLKRKGLRRVRSKGRLQLTPIGLGNEVAVGVIPKDRRGEFDHETVGHKMYPLLAGRQSPTKLQTSAVLTEGFGPRVPGTQLAQPILAKPNS